MSFGQLSLNSIRIFLTTLEIEFNYLNWTLLNSDINSINISDEEVDYHYQVSISLDRAFFPGCLATPAGKPRLENGAHCYIRYKIYDQGKEKLLWGCKHWFVEKKCPRGTPRACHWLMDMGCLFWVFKSALCSAHDIAVFYATWQV